MPVDAKELLKKAERRLAAVHRDLGRISDAPRLLYETELLKGAKVRPYDKEVTVTDYAKEPPAPLTIALEPGVPLVKQIEKRFTLARRLMGAEEAALARLATVEAEVAALRTLAERETPPTDDELLPFLPRRPRPKSVREETPARPYRIYPSASGRDIWVGRSGRNNDLMTFKHAGPHDQWLHASGYAGAHVVVPKKRDEQLDPATLADACLLAAHFSKAPPDDYVEVTVAEVKFIRKFKGANTGQVTVTRETHRRTKNDTEAAKAILARLSQP